MERKTSNISSSSGEAVPGAPWTWSRLSGRSCCCCCCCCGVSGRSGGGAGQATSGGLSALLLLLLLPLPEHEGRGSSCGLVSATESTMEGLSGLSGGGRAKRAGPMEEELLRLVGGTLLAANCFLARPIALALPGEAYPSSGRVEAAVNTWLPPPPPFLPRLRPGRLHCGLTDLAASASPWQRAALSVTTGTSSPWQRARHKRQEGSFGALRRLTHCLTVSTVFRVGVENSGLHGLPCAGSAPINSLRR